VGVTVGLGVADGRGVGVGFGDGRSVGLGRGVGAGVALGVGRALGPNVGVGVGVGLAVALEVAAGVGEAVGSGVGVGHQVAVAEQSGLDRLGSAEPPGGDVGETAGPAAHMSVPSMAPVTARAAISPMVGRPELSENCASICTIRSQHAPRRPAMDLPIATRSAPGRPVPAFAAAGGPRGAGPPR
jgi:hypothetical protein